MLFYLTIGIAMLLFIIGGLALDNDTWWISEIFSCISLTISSFFALVACVMLVVIGTNNIGIESKIAVYEQRYESLVYQIENDVYDNDNDIGKHELYTSVTGWNEDLARYKVLQRDIWMGIFYPDIYDQFEFIELK